MNACMQSMGVCGKCGDAQTSGACIEQAARRQGGWEAHTRTSCWLVVSLACEVVPDWGERKSVRRSEI